MQQLQERARLRVAKSHTTKNSRLLNAFVLNRSIIGTKRDPSGLPSKCAGLYKPVAVNGPWSRHDQFIEPGQLIALGKLWHSIHCSSVAHLAIRLAPCVAATRDNVSCSPTLDIDGRKISPRLWLPSSKDRLSG